MRVVFSRLQNCPGFSDGDFKDGGSAYQHMGAEPFRSPERIGQWDPSKFAP